MNGRHHRQNESELMISDLPSPREVSGITRDNFKAEVVDHHRGPKITGFTYKNKSNQRRRWGHRQELNTIRITEISKG